MLSLPVRLQQREAVAPPLDPRGGVALGDALQRHRRARLHRLLGELEEQHRQSVCKKQTVIYNKSQSGVDQIERHPSEPQVPGGVSGVVVVLCDALVAALVALLHRVDLERGVQRDVVPARERERGLPIRGEYLDGTTWLNVGISGEEYFAHLDLIPGKVSKIFEPYVTSS